MIKINPKWIDAPYLILWLHPGAGSFKEQIERDRKMQEQLEKERAAMISESVKTDPIV